MKPWPERTVRRAPLAALVALAALTGACATMSPESERQARPSGFTVVVENNNWLDATIYVYAAGPRVRLGTVTSMNTRTFDVSDLARGAHGVVLEAELIGSSERKRSAPINVSDGDEIHWIIRNQISLSSYTVW